MQNVKCQFKYILYADIMAHFQIVYHADNVVNSTEQINSKQKWLEKWLKSNKISIYNADKRKFVLFSFNEIMHFPPSKLNNNAIGETFVTKFLGIHRSW